MAMVALLLAAVPLPLAHAKHARESELPERYRKKPYSLMSLSVGYPNRGWQVRAKRLPLYMIDALRAFDRNKVLKANLGNEFSAAYLKIKMDEWNDYSRHLTQWERDNTLDT